MNLEGKPEQFPTKEEIKSAFDHILQGRASRELGTRGNEFHEIEVATEGGGKRVYNFQTAKVGISGVTASIHVIPYDSEGEMENFLCQCVANYRNGTWEYVPEEK